MILAPLLLASVAAAIPDAPKPQPDRVEWSLLASDASVRMLDAYSTRRFLTQHLAGEKVLPDCISHNSLGMYGYSAGIVGFNALLSSELKRHHHNKWAMVPYIVDIGIETPAVVGNLELHSKPMNMKRIIP